MCTYSSIHPSHSVVWNLCLALFESISFPPNLFESIWFPTPGQEWHISTFIFNPFGSRRWVAHVSIPIYISRVPLAHLSVSIFWELRWSQGWNFNPLPLISVRKHTLFPFGNRWRGKNRNLRRQKWHQLVLPNLSMQWSGHFLLCVFDLYCFLFFTHPTSCWCYQAKLLWIQLLCENLKRSSLFPLSWCCHQLELPPIWSSPLLFLDFFVSFLMLSSAQIAWSHCLPLPCYFLWDNPL